MKFVFSLLMKIVTWTWKLRYVPGLLLQIYSRTIICLYMTLWLNLCTKIRKLVFLYINFSYDKQMWSDVSYDIEFYDISHLKCQNLAEVF